MVRLRKNENVTRQVWVSEIQVIEYWSLSTAENLIVVQSFVHLKCLVESHLAASGVGFFHSPSAKTKLW